MKYRSLGTTGWNVSEIGHGTWGMGSMWGPRDDARARQALQRSLELGVNVIDTAYVYGDGHSERLVREMLAGAGRRVYVASKVPPKNFEWPARAGTPLADAFPAEWIVRCTERTLDNLGVECLDLQQLHVWADAWADDLSWLDALHDLRRRGKIAAIGISINDFQPDTALRIVRTGAVDVVQVIYNVFEQAPAARLLPLCAQQRVGVIARVPFDEGGLTGAFTPQTTFHRDDFRRHYFAGDRLQATVDRARALQDILVRREVATLAQGALKFCLSHPAVSTVIPGMRRVEHVEMNCAASDGILLSPDELAVLADHAWPRNFYTTG